MNAIVAFFRLIRLPNVLMMMMTQVMAYYFLTHHLIWTDLFNTRFICLILATMLAAASGYIINDYLDIKIDYINKPQRVLVGTIISRRAAMAFHLSFNIIAVVLGLYVHKLVALSIIICAVMLWLYSVVYKKSFLIGNLMIASLSAFVILILFQFDKSISIYLVGVYSGFAFMSTLIREIIKDLEDMHGDARYAGKTIPITLGMRKSKEWVRFLVMLLILFIIAHLSLGNSFIPYNHRYVSLVYAAYMMLFVVIPIAVFLYLLHWADTKKQFSTLSAYMKWIMLSGMLSMSILKL